MKKIVRVLCLMLVFLMALSSFAGCDFGAADNTDGGTPVEKFVVTYVANKPDGVSEQVSNLPSQVIVEKGKKLTKPTSPALSGYTFKGWFKDLLLENEWIFSTDTVLANMELYAKWTERLGTTEEAATVHLEFAPNLPKSAGSNTANMPATVKDIDRNDKFTKPSDPTLEGHRFVGWFMDSEMQKPWDFDYIAEVLLTELYPPEAGGYDALIEMVMDGITSTLLDFYKTVHLHAKWIPSSAPSNNAEWNTAIEGFKAEVLKDVPNYKVSSNIFSNYMTVFGQNAYDSLKKTYYNVNEGIVTAYRDITELDDEHDYLKSSVLFLNSYSLTYEPLKRMNHFALLENSSTLYMAILMYLESKDCFDMFEYKYGPDNKGFGNYIDEGFYLEVGGFDTIMGLEEEGDYYKDFWFKVEGGKLIGFGLSSFVRYSFAIEYGNESAIDLEALDYKEAENLSQPTNIELTDTELIWDRIRGDSYSEPSSTVVLAYKDGKFVSGTSSIGRKSGTERAYITLTSLNLIEAGEYQLYIAADYVAIGYNSVGPVGPITYTVN